jgi:hypothetical protein
MNTILKSSYITIRETIKWEKILYSWDKKLLYKIINR